MSIESISMHTPGPWYVLDGTRVSVSLPSLTEGCGYDSHCVAITHASSGRLDAHANARLIAELPNLLDALHNALEFIEDHMDVVDGSYGEQRPNRAMELASQIGHVIYKATRSSSVAAPSTPTE